MRTALAVLLLLTGPALAAEPIVGRTSVTDGDTVVIRGTRIPLQRIRSIHLPMTQRSIRHRNAVYGFFRKTTTMLIGRLAQISNIFDQ